MNVMLLRDLSSHLTGLYMGASVACTSGSHITVEMLNILWTPQQFAGFNPVMVLYTQLLLQQFLRMSNPRMLEGLRSKHNLDQIRIPLSELRSQSTLIFYILQFLIFSGHILNFVILYTCKHVKHRTCYDYNNTVGQRPEWPKRRPGFYILFWS